MWDLGLDTFTVTQKAPCTVRITSRSRAVTQICFFSLELFPSMTSVTRDTDTDTGRVTLILGECSGLSLDCFVKNVFIDIGGGGRRRSTGRIQWALFGL